MPFNRKNFYQKQKQKQKQFKFYNLSNKTKLIKIQHISKVEIVLKTYFSRILLFNCYGFMSQVSYWLSQSCEKEWRWCPRSMTTVWVTLFLS